MTNEETKTESISFEELEKYLPSNYYQMEDDGVEQDYAVYLATQKAREAKASN